jgi:hypothetical protein
MLYGYEQQYAVENHRSCFTANVLCGRGVFDETGLFDASMLSSGDFEWSRRAVWKGYDLRYEPDVLVRTPARRSLRVLIRRTRRLTGGRYDSQRLRRTGNAPWLQPVRAKWPSTRENIERLRSYRDAGTASKLLVLPVAVAIRLAFRYERWRLEHGGVRQR